MQLGELQVMTTMRNLLSIFFIRQPLSSACLSHIHKTENFKESDGHENAIVKIQTHSDQHFLSLFHETHGGPNRAIDIPSPRTTLLCVGPLRNCHVQYEPTQCHSHCV